MPEIDPASRERTLRLAVEDQVVTKRATVVFDGPKGVVLAYQRRTNHIGHAIMTLVTAGLWAPIWLGAALGRREDRLRLEVDPWGNVWPVALPGS